MRVHTYFAAKPRDCKSWAAVVMVRVQQVGVRTAAGLSGRWTRQRGYHPAHRGSTWCCQGESGGIDGGAVPGRIEHRADGMVGGYACSVMGRHGGDSGGPVGAAAVCDSVKDSRGYGRRFLPSSRLVTNVETLLRLPRVVPATTMSLPISANPWLGTSVIHMMGGCLVHSYG